MMSTDQEGLFDTEPFSQIIECANCGRTLSNPVSVAVGIGPVCRGWRHVTHHQDYEGGIPLTNYCDGYIAEPVQPKILLGRDGSGRVWTNVPHLVTHHSPDGYEYGYSGSGPADLALNICEVLVRDMGYDEHDRVKCWDGECSEIAWTLHQELKRKFVATLDREGGSIDYEEAREWIFGQIEAL